MKQLIPLALLALSALAQQQTLYRKAIVCDSTGVVETCEMRIPLKIGADRVASIDYDSALSAALPALLQPLIDAAIPAIAAKVAPLIPAPTIPPATSPLPCPGPMLSREGENTVVIGANWSDKTPCRVPQALFPPIVPQPVTEAVLPVSVRIQVPAGASCRGWVWLEKHSLMWSSGACKLPGSVGEVPGIGTHLLGYWQSSAGVVTMAYSPIQPELVHDAWTIQIVNAVRQAAMFPRPGAAVSGTVAMGNGTTITKESVEAAPRVAVEMPSGTEPLARPVASTWTPPVTAAYLNSVYGTCQPPKYGASCRQVYSDAHKEDR